MERKKVDVSAIMKSERYDVARDKLDDLLRRRFFVAPSFEIYGGFAGLFDFGPAGCAVKNNVLSLWRSHFVVADGMFEIECTSLTPRPVLEATQHVAKFQDLMLKDEKNGNCYRADHLLREHFQAAAAKKGVAAELAADYRRIAEECEVWKEAAIDECVAKHGVKSPDGNALSASFGFNLMFATQIGPTGQLPGFLRPETAQGMFVNFGRLLEYNAGKLPFAAAQIGPSYRNEIAPRSGLIRVREFTLAEIEHFIKPGDTKHAGYNSVKHLELNMLTDQLQTVEKVYKAQPKTIEAAMADGTLKNNETIAYFLGRTALFLWSCGVKKEAIRFRQHRRDELAHYATDCWDGEILTSYGWIECTGLANREAFDLTRHAEATGKSLQAYEAWAEPKIVDAVEIKANKGKLGKELRKDAGRVIAFLESEQFTPAASKAAFDEMEGDKGKTTITLPDGANFDVTKGAFTRKDVKKKISGESFTPNVVEPTFGIGRIMHALFEHSFYAREADAQRCVLGLPAHIAPTKVSVLPLIDKPALQPPVHALSSQLRTAQISAKVDASGVAIGRRYARTDELGIPFGITVDFETLEKETVTLRERDSTDQVRVPLGEIVSLLVELCASPPLREWSDVVAKYPRQQAADDEKEKEK